MVAVLAAPALVALVFALNLARIEPFATFFYLFAWYGLIAAFDQLVRRREGRSLIGRCGGGFALVLVWSAATWYFFELLNLRLQNWYYVFVTDQPALRPIGTFLSFATVFPGILWIDHYLASRGIAAGRRGPRLRLSARGRRGLQVAGLVCLVLPMVWPTWFFPLVWCSTFMLLAPLEERSGGGLLRQLEEGDYGPLLRTLLAGLIAGFCWESLNFWARAKWIYTVPFFDRLKLFEMPLAGFLGFPPFAVECTVIYRLLAWYRLTPAFGSFAARGPGPTRRVPAIAAVAAAVVFSLAVDQLVVGPVVVASVTPRAALVETIDGPTVAALEGCGVEYLTALEGLGAPAAWHCLEGRLATGQLADLHRLSALYLHQGIGIEYGNLLVRAGINSPADLSGLDALGLHQRLQRVAKGARLPTLPQLRVWIRRAPKPG
jgi:hypothetical protein